MSPSYHDLHITTAQIPRTSLFDLPYALEVTCTRVGGWQLWRHPDSGSRSEAQIQAGEYETRWLILDVDGHEIVNSRDTDDGDG